MNFKKWRLAMFMFFIIFSGCWELGHLGQRLILPPTPAEMIGWVNYPAVFVSHMAEDIYGNIWCAGTVNGIRGIWAFDGASWRLYSAKDIGVPDPVKVKEIYCGKDGKIYIALTDPWYDQEDDYAEGIGVYDGADWSVIKESTTGLVSNKINCICVDKNDYLWAGTDKGLCKFDGTNWRLFTKADGLLNDTILDVDYYGNKVFCFTRLGFAQYDGISWTVAKYESVYSTNCIKDFNGNLYLAKLAKVAGFIIEQCIGYWYYDGQHWQFLSQERNSTIFAVDAEGKFWISVSGDGVAGQTSSGWVEFYSYATGVYPDIYSDSRGNSGLLNSDVRVIFIDSKNNKWFATSGGLSRYELD